jgi:hypothetical protein
MKKLIAAACMLTCVMTGTLIAQEPEWNPANVKECNRACLVNIVDGYMNAIFKHDPKAAPPLAKDIRMTENTAQIDVGEGVLWRSRVEPTSFKIYVADPVAGQVAIQTRLKIQGRDALVAVRLENRSRENPGNRAILRPERQRGGDSPAHRAASWPSERCPSRSAQVARIHDLGRQFILRRP